MVVSLLEKRKQNRYIAALEDTLRAGGAGILTFNSKQKFEYANYLARDYINTLDDKNVVKNLTDFLSYLFDHALEDDADLPTQYIVGNTLGQPADFNEVVRGNDDDVYLIQMHKLLNGRTIVLIRDVDFVKKQNSGLDALNRTNEELNLAIESASCGVFILDAKHPRYPVKFANRMCRHFVGGDTDEACDVDFAELLKRFGVRDDMDFFCDVVRNAETQQKQVRFYGVDEVRWYDFRLTPVFLHDGVLDLYVGVINDISALKTREAEFFKAQKLDSLGQLSAGLAHDFNNILSIIEGYASMIATNADNPAKVSEYIEKITNSSRRGSGLTRQMMTFARHKMTMTSVVDLKALLREQEVLLKPLLDERVSFDVWCDEADLFVECDSDSFVQIVMNLVINARDAMLRGGKVDVSLKAVDSDVLPSFISNREIDYVCLKVRDNGSGIPEDVRERIFDPFFTTKKQGEGTGLGLSVVYGLVKDMGGYVDVQSEFSKGSAFSVYIPRTDKQPSKVLSGDRDDIESINFKGYTALVVEDEPDLRAIIAEFLQRRGMHVLEAESGNDALVVQDDHVGDIDVLLTDLVMPGITGIKLGEMVKALRPETHIVFMSGYPARGEGAKVNIPEDAVFIPKSIDYDGLCVALFEILGAGHSVQ